MRRSICVVVWLVLTVVLSSACGTDANSPASVNVEGSRVRTFASMEELLAETALVVEVSRAQVPENIDEITTLTHVDIDKVWRGQAQNMSGLDIRQIGPPRGERGEFSPLLESGERYVLFLSPFEFTPGEPTDEWTIVGDVGIYERDGDRLTLLGMGAGDSVPTSMSTDDLSRILQRYPS